MSALKDNLQAYVARGRQSARGFPSLEAPPLFDQPNWLFSVFTDSFMFESLDKFTGGIIFVAVVKAVG
jgi:hypothetical protein